MKVNIFMYISGYFNLAYIEFGSELELELELELDHLQLDLAFFRLSGNGIRIPNTIPRNWFQWKSLSVLFGLC